MLPSVVDRNSWDPRPDGHVMDLRGTRVLSSKIVAMQRCGLRVARAFNHLREARNLSLEIESPDFQMVTTHSKENAQHLLAT